MIAASQVPRLSVFFTAYHDGGTIASLALYPRVGVVTDERKRGYGGVLQSGMASASRDLVFCAQQGAPVVVVREIDAVHARAAARR